MQADVLEKAVEGTLIQGPLKTVRSEVESVIKSVEGNRPEVEGILSETISRSIDTSAAAAQQVTWLSWSWLSWSQKDMIAF